MIYLATVDQLSVINVYKITQIVEVACNVLVFFGTEIILDFLANFFLILVLGTTGLAWLQVWTNAAVVTIGDPGLVPYAFSSVVVCIRGRMSSSDKVSSGS